MNFMIFPFYELFQLQIWPSQINKKLELLPIAIIWNWLHQFLPKNFVGNSFSLKFNWNNYILFHSLNLSLNHFCKYHQNGRWYYSSRFDLREKTDRIWWWKAVEYTRLCGCMFMYVHNHTPTYIHLPICAPKVE